MLSDLGPLQLKHLALIAAISDHRQLSLAAHALRITQPAASRTLAEAEARVGTALFLRHPKGMELTAVGESLVRRARNILDELADARDEVARLRQGRGGVVRIGAVTGAAVGYVAPAIRALQSLVPQVELYVDVATSDVLLSGLLAMRYDLIMARLPARLPPEPLQIRPARGEDVHILAHPKHAHAGNPKVQLADLCEDEWVLQGPGTPIRRAIEEQFLSLGLALPGRIINSASLLMALAFLDGPGSVTAVSAEVAGLLTRGDNGLVRLDMAVPMRVESYGLITLRDRRLSPAASRCRDLLAQLVQQASPALTA